MKDASVSADSGLEKQMSQLKTTDEDGNEEKATIDPTDHDKPVHPLEPGAAKEISESVPTAAAAGTGKFVTICIEGKNNPEAEPSRARKAPAYPSLMDYLTPVFGSPNYTANYIQRALEEIKEPRFRVVISVKHYKPEVSVIPPCLTPIAMMVIGEKLINDLKSWATWTEDNTDRYIALDPEWEDKLECLDIPEGNYFDDEVAENVYSEWVFVGYKIVRKIHTKLCEEVNLKPGSGMIWPTAFGFDRDRIDVFWTAPAFVNPVPLGYSPGHWFPAPGGPYLEVYEKVEPEERVPLEETKVYKIIQTHYPKSVLGLESYICDSDSPSADGEDKTKAEGMD
ncbi:hypothetical protein BJ508DRAFT_344217 [Ascobolus immersus RN42]|uniref:Uncharacterized protein n=1 Tax=Ascobolus immersus RN42 TaxID=1160509 RepID=A0A3N4HFK0_ASCIM|nr:hypothetical protein BJ508DRAFT_344217 [Ascobolus immersus RN42]